MSFSPSPSVNCALNLKYHNIWYIIPLSGISEEVKIMTSHDKILKDVLKHMQYFENVGVSSFDTHLEDMPFTIQEELISLEDLEKSQVSPLRMNDKAKQLCELRDYAKSCQKCPLFYTRKHVVFGRGDSKASIMFIGGYPSEMDDFTEIIYGDNKGDLLNRIIRAMKTKLSEFFITTVLKCHPPKGTEPRTEEIKACLPYLTKQIEIVEPRIIVTLGPIAYKALMNEEPKIHTKRENWESYLGTPLISTYDLDEIISKPSVKKGVWQDMKSVVRKYQEIKEKENSQDLF
ncbi:MAG: hypothetical protein COA79_12305 [Planctomycetota bacterium]|nr:MAG: hypothetical protein COA79_12305 [Planctomycetota bacterium]